MNGYNLIASYKSDPKNVPIIYSEGNYYVSISDVEQYMEAAGIFDYVTAMNDIAKTALKESSDISRNNLIVVGYMDESIQDVLESAGVVLEMKAKDLMSIDRFSTNVRVGVKKIIGNIKKDPNVSEKAIQKEIDNLKRVIGEIDKELALSNEELKKKKISTAARFIGRVTAQMVLSQAIALAGGAAVGNLLRKVTGKSMLSASAVFDVVVKEGLPLSAGITAGTAIGTAVGWAIGDYRDTLKAYKTEANNIIRDLESKKNK